MFFLLGPMVMVWFQIIEVPGLTTENIDTTLSFDLRDMPEFDNLYKSRKDGRLN
jgi:hypothetical protein